MATRAIVTSHPVIACDVCGRRLLRGENPDVFLAGGQRRTVCELCVPRASAEGWLREADNHASSVRPSRSRRAGSLLGRLRQLREPAERPLRRESRSVTGLTGGAGEGALAEDGLYDFLEGGSIEHAATHEQELDIGSVEAVEPVDGESSAERGSAGDGQALQESELPRAATTHGGGRHPEGHTQRAHGGKQAGERVRPVRAEGSAGGAVTSGELKVERALEVFNAGEPPRRVAGVARSLGPPSVAVRPLEESGSTVAIVVAWELCWYRYEVDLGDEAAGPRLVAQGLELDELPEEDRLANASADERGELAALLV
jgi:hypothetical protein